jgi:D-sedoheptulose 7-phosphate isomerase
MSPPPSRAAAQANGGGRNTAWLEQQGRRELEEHLDQLVRALRNPRAGLGTACRWGRLLARPLLAGHRLLAAGNGGSAAEAQHLTAELVGRYRDDRQPLSAIALHAETSSLTAICNDFGAAEAFARQVGAHGREGDTLLVLSASGRSANVLAAAERAASLGIRVWAMTGPAPNPLASGADDAVCVPAPDTATVQEVHLVAVHALCAALDAEIARITAPGEPLGRPREPLRGRRPAREAP